MAREVLAVPAAFGWAIVGVFGLVLVAAVVFILGFVLSMFVSIVHGSVVGIEHVAQRATHHEVGHHSGRLAVHH